jgi:hypothetical protein
VTFVRDLVYFVVCLAIAAVAVVLWTIGKLIPRGVK